MAKIRMKSASIPSSPEVKIPKFNFCEYSVGSVYVNNEDRIDFVSDGKSLYVCVVPSVQATQENINAQQGLLKLVSQGPQGIRGIKGEDGISGVTPTIDAQFVNDNQLQISVNGSPKALSPSLTGLTWKPVLDGHTLTWELTDDKYSPESIDLNDLRPIQKHPILFRTNSDNTKRSDEWSGPANFIQWKYEGDEHWTNLISIQELMNLALLGICFWYDECDDDWHFGTKEVVKATYRSDKNGRKIVSRVELGDVLFDAGAVPFKDYAIDIEFLTQEILDIKNGLVRSVNGILPDPTTGNIEVPIPNTDDCVKGVKINGGSTVYRPSNGIVNLPIESSNLDGVVKSITVDGVKKTPDEYGDIAITLGDVDLTDYVRKEDLATINGAILYNGGNITINGGNVSGLQDIEFRINSGELQYRKQTDGSWGSYTKIMDISAVSGGEHVALSIHDGKLWISYNDGAEEEVGSIGGESGTDPDAFINVTLYNNVLTFARRSGENPISITLPSSGSTSGMTEAEVKHLIGQILEGVLDSAIPEYVRTSGHNYFVRINELNTRLSDYYTKTQIDNMLAGYDPSDPGSITVISYRTFTIYTWYSVSANPATPALPTSASWDGTSSGLTLTGNTNNWTDHPGNRPNDSTRLWLATITLQSDGTSSNDWVGPIDLTAYPGKDGSGVEFIYTLCANKTEFNALTTPTAQHNDNRDDDYPAHWTDQPQGIGTYSASDNIETFHTFTGNEQVLFRIEAASIRTSRNGQWSTYCAPFIWSMWGEDGLDGDGVEYIFFLTDGTNGVVTESNGVYSLNQNNWPDNSWAYEYQAPNSGWTDDPSGVSASVPYEFVSKRKYHMDPETRQGAWSNWSEPALWSIWKQGDRGPEGNAVTVTDQQRYYKASNLSTGVTAPAITEDPTLAANGSWQTSSNSMQLDENNPYLWFFERITYSNGNKWQSTPVVIRYFNSAVNVDYQEIQDNVLEAVGEDLGALDERLSKVVDTNGDIVTDGDNGLIAVITNYTDSNQKSFADLVVDAKETEIKQWAGSVIDDQLVTAGTTINGLKGQIDTKVTAQDVDGKISDARTSWDIDGITSSVTKAQYVWVKDSDGSILPYNGESSKTGYTKTLVANAMSAIQQESDKVSIIVGQNGNVKADIIVDAINDTTGGSTVQIDADHIILNGDAVANAINAKYANVGGGAVVLDANGLQATGANIEGTITATAGTFGGNNGVKITQNGVTLGSDCSIDWDNVDKTNMPTFITRDSLTTNKITANEIDTSDLEVDVANVNGLLEAGQIKSSLINADEIHATVAEFEYLTVNGVPIGENKPLNIVFGVSSVPSSPKANTLYFLY